LIDQKYYRVGHNGGCAIRPMWRCALSVRSDILSTNSRRVFAIRFSNNDWQLLVLCVYMCKLRETDLRYYPYHMKCKGN